MIVDVAEDPRAWEPFLALPERLYRGDRGYCPVRREEITHRIGREKFMGRQRVLVAMENGTCVARLVARISPWLKGEGGRPYGTIGFFEAEDRPEAVRELLDAGIRWLQHRGTGAILGPMEGDPWHDAPFNLGPYEAPPFLMEPYQKEFYPRLWQEAGFAVYETYCAKRLDDAAGAAPKFAPAVARVLEQGYRLRSIDLSHFRDELELVYPLAREAYAEEPFARAMDGGKESFSDRKTTAGKGAKDGLSFAEFLGKFEPLLPLLNARLVWFAESPEGGCVGYALAMVDYQAAVAARGTGCGPLAQLRFRWNRRRARAVNAISIGVTAAHRRKGIGSALMGRVCEQTRALGFQRVNLGLIREGSAAAGLDLGTGTISRRYALYQYSAKNL